MGIVEQAQALRAQMDAAGQLLTDEQAAECPRIFPVWAGNFLYTAGQRVQHGGAVYRCRQSHTSQEIYPPEAVPALWVRLDVSGAGTADKPISAARGMEYVYGLYYLDPEDGGIYRCARTGETEGGKVVLQYLPHELVGMYFEKGAV